MEENTKISLFSVGKPWLTRDTMSFYRYISKKNKRELVKLKDIAATRANGYKMVGN